MAYNAASAANAAMTIAEIAQAEGISAAEVNRVLKSGMSKVRLKLLARGFKKRDILEALADEPGDPDSLPDTPDSLN